MVHIISAMPSKKKPPIKGGRRSIELTDQDRRRLVALRKHYARALELDENHVAEQTVISWAIRDAAKSVGLEGSP